MAFVYLSLLYCHTGLPGSPQRPGAESKAAAALDVGEEEQEEEGEREDDSEDCCRGLEQLELMRPAVKWGTPFKFSSSKECCKACKAMCEGGDSLCLCDLWVFCGDRKKCGEKFGQCWLKKRKDVLFPSLKESGQKVIWTSGLIFGKGEGIVGMVTEHGTLHIKLLPDCAPYSVAYIFEQLESNHCAGCHFYRAEGRGHSWDSKGNHITNASLGPPYALVQGTLETEGVRFKEMPMEACPMLRRGSVAWIGSGPSFFISLANHDDWKGAFTVFGAVLPQDMAIVEKIARLPTKSDVWGNTTVSVLLKPVQLRFKRITKSQEVLKFGSNSSTS